MDKFNGVIIFATNLFENYDEAFLRRTIQELSEMDILFWEAILFLMTKKT